MHRTTSVATDNRKRVNRVVMWCALLLGWLSTTGCSLILDTHHVLFLAKRTTKLEPEHFPYIKNEKLSRLRDLRLAKGAWNEVSAASGDNSFSKHYRRGFLSGFSDYMYRGGTGEPPLIPPRDYWRLGYQSPDGKQATQDWYDGFRHGVEECQARGHREMVVVRSSLLGSSVTLTDEAESPVASPRYEPTPAELLPVPAHPEIGTSPADDDDRYEVESTWGPLRIDDTDGQESAETQVHHPRRNTVGARLRRQ